MTIEQKVMKLHGPVLVLGASGFIGVNLMRMLLRYRRDVYGTASRLPAWRLEDQPSENIIVTDLLVQSNVSELLETVKPMTVFDCVAYGAYSFEDDAGLIYRTNLSYAAMLLELLADRSIRTYVHAGSSSEYGLNATAPSEDSLPMPNSHYSVSKLSCASLIFFMGRLRKLPCVNLRLYSIYGPFEDSSRLIPNVVMRAAEGGFPEFVNPDTSRDFVYINDACEAFLDAANNLVEADYGSSINIGSGRETTIREIADMARKVLGVKEEPRFMMTGRKWDLVDWYSDPSLAKEAIGWEARTPMRQGLELTAKWYNALTDKEAYAQSSKKYGLNKKRSISVIVACYQDVQAIPIMYERLTKVFEKLDIVYEIIFVNDGSPDNSEDVICQISASDRRVMGITHSRNFGSQAAFKSGLELSSMNACVLMDGDLQDPPEIIEKFVEKWREGYEIVYGRRIKRHAPWYMQLAYKAFYRLFDSFSYISIPHDAGDFSLFDKRVAVAMLKFPERDLFIRGLRAFVGFKHTGVDYVRPERMFGVSTNNLLKNIGWAKKGIFSFTNVPLNILTAFGTGLFIISLLIIAGQVSIKFMFPELAPKGITTLMLLILFFGSSSILAISIVGEYIAKIFEEVKRRPHFLRKSIIQDGEIRNTADEQLYISEGHR